MLSAVVCIRRCTCCRQRDICQRFRHQHSLLCQYRLCLFASPHLQARRRQQRMGAADTMVKSCSGERLKMSILVQILLNKEPSSVTGQSQQHFAEQESGGIGGIRGKYRNSRPTGIPAKNSCKNGKKQEFLRPPPNPRSSEKFLRKTQEKQEILRKPVRNGFLGSIYIPENRNYQPRRRECPTCAAAARRR